jgi:uncharacterized membrane-anchored protein
MRIAAIIAAVMFQVGILAYMGGEREYILHTGKIIYLRTAPVDPQDAFRGDYVHLDYEISNVPASSIRDGLKGEPKHGERVYAVLDVDENQVGQVRYVSDKRPDNELFIRGRVSNRWGGAIQYGIEAFFVEQGKGREIEKLRGTRRDIQVPLEMEAAVGTNGIAVLKGYRTGKLGIGIEMKTDANDRNRQGRNFVPMRIVGAKVKLKNVSDTPLAIIDLPDGRSFTLEPDTPLDFRWGRPNLEVWQWVNENAPRKTVENSDVRVLQAGQEYEFAIDFRNPVWFVTKGNEPPHTISDPNMGWGNNFRLVYRPPSKDECKLLEKADMIWHGYLRSSSFCGGGRID